MIICQCTGTTDRDIARLREQGLETVAAVALSSGAGRCCGPCRREIASLLRTGDDVVGSGERAA